MDSSAPASSPTPFGGALRRLFAPPPDAPMLPEGEEMRRTYSYWRTRQLYSTFTGYAVYYFVRKNMPVALPLMEAGLGISKAQLGIFLTLQDVVYGFSKFANGFLGDRSNARTFMALGLLLSAVMNLVFGLSSALYVLGITWVLNGWFQGMGFPPCARVLSHWFSQKERGTKWGIWNASHMVGGGLIAVFAGVLAENVGWRAAFTVPAFIAIAVSLLLLERLRDRPGALGLPPVEQFTGEESAPQASQLDKQAFKRLLREKVFGNPYIWLICVANFFVYVVRIAFMNWLPTLLKERGMPLSIGGAMVLNFEIAGLIGALAAGWISDKVTRGRRTPVATIYMIALALAVWAFWKAPANLVLTSVLVFLVGFTVYGPQFLVGVTCADLATKQAAATAIGVTAVFGYASGPVTGWGMGWLVDHYGWNGGFAMLLGAAIVGAIPFALAWNAGVARPAPEPPKPLEPAVG